MGAGWLFLAMLLAVSGLLLLRLPLPAVFLGTSLVGALLGGAGLPFRHLVEGTFGYLYPILILFSGAIFARFVKAGGIAPAVGDLLSSWVRDRPVPILLLAAGLVYVAGMFTGFAGAAVLFGAPFAIPMLLRLGLSRPRVAALLAIQGMLGMAAPPINLPAALIADGVNMPYSEFTWVLLALSLPPALFAAVYLGWPVVASGRQRARVAVVPADGADPVDPPAGHRHGSQSGSRRLLLLLPLVVPLAIWIAVRSFPDRIADPAVPLVLVIGALAAAAVAGVRFHPLREAYEELGGTVLHLGAVLATVGVLVQIMTLTGVRGWLVVQSLSLKPPWTYLGVLVSTPLLGGALTSLGAASILGVPYSLVFIDRDMVVNASALSLISSLAELVPPTAIAAILAGYLAGETRISAIWKEAAVPAAVIATTALLALAFSSQLGGWLR